jgi:peptidoglycan-associated lipoprotein
VVNACATTGALRKAQDEARAALYQEQSQRIAGDSALHVEVGHVRADLNQLRAEVQAMRTEFNAKITAMEDGLHFALPVNFAFDDATVRAQDYPVLDRFARIARKYYPGSAITVEGFADPAGSPGYNRALSERRAEAVRQYVVGKGVGPAGLKAVGYGATRFVYPGAQRDMPGAEANRRAVFVIESRAAEAAAVASGK